MTTPSSASAMFQPQPTAGSPYKMEFGAGFRRFLSSMPDDEIVPQNLPIRQPVQFLEAVPTLEACAASTAEATARTAIQDSLSRSLSAAIFLASRPSTQYLSLAHTLQGMHRS